MAFVMTSEAKAYLRVDSNYEDGLIETLLLGAETLCMDVAKLSVDEWNAIFSLPSDSTEGLVIRTKEKSPNETFQMREILRVSILYALGYLYEHREEADYHDLVLTLRNLLFSIREGVL